MRREPDELARRARSRILAVTRPDVPSHLASALSAVEILSTIYAAFVDLDGIVHGAEDRDRVILSKGHAALALYAVLVECGLAAEDSISDYGPAAQCARVHPRRGGFPGIEATTGGLGHGIGLGAGIAIGNQLRSSRARTIVVLGDGELQKGSIWEAALLASHRRLGGLIAVVDANGLQQTGTVEDIGGLQPLDAKWEAFGWHVEQADGHDTASLISALERADEPSRPGVVLATTIKGRGLPEIEGQDGWHYRAPGQLLAEVQSS
jgi:transketolase